MPYTNKPVSELESYIASRLQETEEQGLRRRPPRVTYTQGINYEIAGNEVVSFCSNDFLGFASQPTAGERDQRTGSGASRLVHGDHSLVREVEATFAEHLGYEDCILLNSGYQANIAALAQLPVPKNCSIYSDEANHASIIDALRISRAPKEIVPHLQPPPRGPHWWIVESRYSMDGDAPSAKVLNNHLDSGGFLYLDEAHRFGLESHGHGLAQKLTTRPQLANYPLGKAFGFQGAILAGTHSCIDWIRQFGRAYIYTTAPGPGICRQVLARFQQVVGTQGDLRRDQLEQNTKFAQECFEQKVDGPIISVPIGDNNDALRLSQKLLEHGYHIQAIRPPTVPEGTARLRITLSALHRPEQIRALSKTFKTLSKHETA